MKQSPRHDARLFVIAFALIISILLPQTALYSDQIESNLRDESYSKFVDEWFERLSEAEPQNASAEFEEMVEAAGDDFWSTRWPLAVSMRMLEENVHVEHAAAYLLDYVESGDDHPVVDLSQNVLDRLVPVLLDRLESPVPPVCESGKKWVTRFRKIPDEHSAEIRALIWDWSDDPFRQVEGCRLLARLANVTQADRDAIVACLESPDNIVVKAAIEAAAAISDTTFLPEIQKRLNHINEGVSIEAATAILQIIEGHPSDAGLTPLTRQALNTLNFHYNDGSCEEVLEHAKLVPRSILRLPELLRDALASPAEIHSGGFYTFDTGLHVSASEILYAAGQDALPLVGQWLADSNTPVPVRQRLLSNLLEINADQLALHATILQQLQSGDEEVRTLTMRLLTKYGAVNASLLETVKADSETSRLILISALGEASETTRQSAISFLRKSLEDKSPDIRVAAAASLVKLGDMTPEVRGIPKQLIADLDKLTWNEEGWYGFGTLMDLTKQIRPSPDGLADELLKAVQAYPNRNVRPDTAALENEKGDSTEGTTEDDERISIAYRAAELLASLDNSAFDARVELSRHFNGNIRKEAILQLGASGDERALFPIVTHLFDRSQYSFMISIDMGGWAEMRTAAIKALASPQLDGSPIASMLCDLMEEDWAATHAAQALGQCRSSADQISRRLKAIELVKPDDRAIANGATVARLEKDDSRRWHVMTAVLRLLRQPKYASGAAPDSQRSDDFLLQTLQTLHREGISIEPLRTELEFLAIDQPCLHFPTRAEIVTILAEISPNDPRWLSMLKSWRAQEDISFGTADLLIDTLPPGLQSKIR
jgi:HEAT repeat protein